MMIGIHVAKQDGRAVHAVDDHVDLAVVEEVTKRCAPADGDDGQPCLLDCGHQFEFAFAQIVIEQRALRVALSPLRVLIDLRIDVAVHDEQILPAVIVVIEEAIAKFDKGDRRLGDSRLVTDICEGSSAIVPEKYGVIV